ncbi:MAG TPA: family 20 glycosylhydrolase [Candidatus Kryptonia bacterium]
MREIAVVILLMVVFGSATTVAQSSINVIPKPDSVVYINGAFRYSAASVISSDDNLGKLAEYLSEQLALFTKISPALVGGKSTDGSGLITLDIDSTSAPANPESYKLDISREKIALTARTEAGLFRGIQTLLQIFPPADSLAPQEVYLIPCCTIIDHPRFSWRGLNLDCCRHFMTKDFIKRYIDLLAYYKFNILHWHLTDDQGWRIEIKKYPRLTQVGAWRKEPDGSVYGGFYTQEDIREIVAYAESRYINVVPEIEMPGHCMASLAAYPENSCTGGPFDVGIQWGVYKDVYCAGRDSTFIFLENILDEVMQLFPSHYIHIGGDEVPKDRWKACPRCQRRIKDNNLKDEEELQSYFIKRIEKYVESKGGEIIGWDEILEGGLAPGATVQSWRGVDGAIQAAQSKHNTIVSPGDYAYFDRSVDELDLDTVYSFNPVPAGLSPDESKYVLGTEANMWSERAPQETVDSKLFPRILALSEVGWTELRKKDYKEFHNRLEGQYERLSCLGVDYGLERKAIGYKTYFDEVKKDFTIELESLQAGTKIRYTLDGGIPSLSSPLYESPLTVKGTSQLIAQSVMNGKLVGNPIDLAFMISKTLNASVSLNIPFWRKYPASGAGSLVDGVRGTMDFRDGLWQGYEGVDIDAVIDLGRQTEISQIGAGFYQNTSSWIFMPDSVVFSVSTDGVKYNQLGVARNDVPQKDPDPVKKDFTLEFGKQNIRFLRVQAKNIGVCPPWHEGAGGKAWLFIDEVYAN